ncbi:hypothetical protein EMIT0P176_30105 [Pseudomonas sp. IT-P176]
MVTWGNNPAITPFITLFNPGLAFLGGYV